MTLAAVRRPLLWLWQSSAAKGCLTPSTGFRITRGDLRLLLLLIVVSRIVIALAIALSYLSNTSRLETGPDDMFCNWDCDWYVGIAENGYQHLNDAGQTGAANWAFFPLLPVLMWGLSSLTRLPTVYSGLIIAQVAWSIGLYLVFLAARDLKGPGFARHAAIVYAVWPFAVHASMPMTEAVFVPLTIAAFLFARRGDWLSVAIAVALLSASRAVGVIFVLPALMLVVREFGWWRLLLLRPGTERAALALGATGLGLGLYMIHIYGVTGDALAFSHNQAAWSRKFELPWMMLFDELNPVYISSNWLVANVLDIGSGLGAVALLVLLWRRGFLPEALFALATLLIAFDSGNASSLPRYSGGLYPVMLAVAVLSDTPLLRNPAYAILLAGMASAAFGWGMEQFYVM